MPQPVISGAPLTCKFGSLSWPNGQGTFTQMNLNDGVNWQWQQFGGDDDYVQLTPAQLVWRARSAVLARDRKARVLTLPMRYQEASTAPSAALGAQIALLDQAGQQQLTFDNSTYILANYAGLKSRTMLKKFSPFYWGFSLEFLCPEPYFHDIATTTYVNALALNSGTATNTNVTYAGSVWAEPVYTLAIPNTNAAPIASFTLANSVSSETLLVTFPGNLAASTAWTITIDAGALSVTDQLGRGYDVAGSFPNLYPPAGQVQQISATLTPASGTATACTLTAAVANRWLL